MSSKKIHRTKIGEQSAICASAYPLHGSSGAALTAALANHVPRRFLPIPGSASRPGPQREDPSYSDRDETTCCEPARRSSTWDVTMSAKNCLTEEISTHGNFRPAQDEVLDTWVL